MGSQRGFTLIELITAMVVLVIVSVGISGFVRSSMEIYADVTERDQLLSDSRFVVQRISRELRNAIPNSVRVAGNSTTHCLQFVPIDYSTFYTDVPILPSVDNEITVVEMNDIFGNVYQPIINTTYAFVYPSRSIDVYDSSNNRRKLVTACRDDGSDTSCASADSPSNTADVEVTGAFAAESPAQRVYFGSVTKNYCVRGNAIYFHQSGITQSQTVFTSGGTLMGEYLVNNLSNNPKVQGASSDDPFRIFNATLLSNAYVQLRMRFDRNEETINYNQEVHIANAP